MRIGGELGESDVVQRSDHLPCSYKKRKWVEVVGHKVVVTAFLSGTLPKIARMRTIPRVHKGGRVEGVRRTSRFVSFR